MNPALFQLPKKDRGDFSAVKFPGSEEGLEAFAGFLENHVQFEAPTGDLSRRRRCTLPEADNKSTMTLAFLYCSIRFAFVI